MFGISSIYDTSALKFAQFLIDGDIKSNPGPTFDHLKGGRPKKSKSFCRNTPKPETAPKSMNDTKMLKNRNMKYKDITIV